MTQTDPITAALMAPGAPFEVVAKDGIRVFRHTPENMSVIFDRARSFGTAEFIVAGEQRLTYDDFFARADALAAELKARGVSAGQSVGICMQNCPEWMIAFVAILNAGAVAVLLNSRGTGEAMARALSDTDCELVLADQKRADKLKSSVCPVMLGSDFPKSAESFTAVPRSPSDLAAMFFTSGTTGTAKAAAIDHQALITGVMNTQLAMAAVFQKMAKAYGMDVETLRAQMPQSTSLLVFPLFHTSGCSSVFLTAMGMGGRLVLMERWSAQGALSLIQEEKITSFGGVPTMFWDVLRAPDFASYDLSSLMSLSCGGQALPQNLLAEIRSTFPRAYIGAGYGMTESCGAVSQANGEAFLAKPTASGQVLPMVDVQITGEDGQALPAGETGEIWVKGATLMQGYYGRPEETAQAYSGAWFKTGDIGRLDEAGYIYIVDRKTDMIISGGENIYCAEVEQVLSRHESIIQIAAFGAPDDRLGERLVAAVYTAGEMKKSDLLAFAKATMADYMVPSDFLLQDKPFELSAMGKIEKHKLRAAYMAANKV